MAIESIGANIPSVGLDAAAPDAGSSLAKGGSGKISPDVEGKIIDTFLAGMITNQLQLNSQLFDFAKEAINEADSE